MYYNLQKARQLWKMISKVLVKMVATVLACGMLYKAVEQTLLLYWRNSWVVMGSMLKVFEGFRHWEAQGIAVMMDWHAEDREL